MKLNVITLLAASLLLTSCAMTGPTGGVLYHDIKYGINSTPEANVSKVGQACQSSVLGLVAFGDATIDTAKRESGITKVSSIDASSNSILFGVYNKYCTIVKGN